MTFPPFLSVSTLLTAPGVALDLSGLNTSAGMTALLGGGLIFFYTLKKLDTLKEMLIIVSFILISCILVITLPQFSDTGAVPYAMETLALINQLLNAVIQLIYSWVGGQAPALIGGLI